MKDQVNGTKYVSFRGWIKSVKFADAQKKLDLIDGDGEFTVLIRDVSIIKEIRTLKWINYATISCILMPTGNRILELQELLELREGTPNNFSYTDHKRRHLFNRQERPRNTAIISNWIIRYLRNFFADNNWVEVNTPLLSTIAEACEDTSSLFWIEDYYSTKAFLVQTSQFYLESLLVPNEKVFAITHSFRNERKCSSKHLSEYTHVEAEAAWYTIRDLQLLVSTMIAELLRKMKGDETIFRLCCQLNKDFSNRTSFSKIPFLSITYDECIKLLKEHGGKITWGDDLDIEHEKLLATIFDEPFFVTYWPKNIKAFYMKEYSKNPELVESFDLILPDGYGELVGASVRESQPGKLWKRLHTDSQLRKMSSEMLNIDLYKWYIELREHSSVPHGGFGMGLERLVSWILDLGNIDKAVLYPRVPNETDII